jgi:2',3'-cyclic-nucleotide 2'-phosphodiesterase
MIKVLILGEIIGIPAIRKISKTLKAIIKENEIDFTMANDDGASDGYGILRNSSCELYNAGINVLTGGDNIFNKKDVRDLLKLPFQLRPFNLPNTLGGRGFSIYSINEKIHAGIINVMGRINFNKTFPMDPFHAIDKALEKLQNEVKIIIVDFHGGATSEIQAMCWHLAGKVTCIVGSHLRVLTSDNRIVNNRTAVVTCTGYCGAEESICGLQTDIEINKIKNGRFTYSKVEKENLMLQGVIVQIDENTGAALNIELFKKSI